MLDERDTAPIGTAASEPGSTPRQQSQALAAVVAAIVHDLNNVFSSLKIAVPLLRRESGSQQSDALLEIVDSASDRGMYLLEETRLYLRAAGSGPVSLDVKVLVEAAVQIVRERSDDACRFATRYDSGLPRVEGDPEQVFDLVWGLLLDAAEWARPDSVVSIHGVSGTSGGSVSDPEMAVAPVELRIECSYRMDQLPVEKALRRMEGARNLAVENGGELVPLEESGKITGWRVLLPATSAESGGDLVR